MKKQFVTYEVALKLKELGFDEECLGYFGIQNELKIEISYNSDPNLIRRNFISAPLWQQVIDWFREKHNIYIYIKPVFDNLDKSEMYQWEMKIKNRVFIKNGDYKDFYETREQGILKAIELCQNKK